MIDSACDRVLEEKKSTWLIRWHHQQEKERDFPQTRFKIIIIIWVDDEEGRRKWGGGDFSSKIETKPLYLKHFQLARFHFAIYTKQGSSFKNLNLLSHQQSAPALSKQYPHSSYLCSWREKLATATIIVNATSYK